MSSSKRDLVLRVLSAVVLVPPLVWLILRGPSWAWAAVVAAAAAIAQAEFYAMALREEGVWVRLMGIGLGVLVSGVLLWWRRPQLLVVVLGSAVIAVSIGQLLRAKELARVAAQTAYLLFGVLYVPLLLATVGLLRTLPSGGGWVLLTLCVSWFSDTGAYFTGRRFGKRQLSPTVSPAKSQEGALGGMVASLAAAAVAKLWYLPQLGWLDVALLGIVGSVLGQCGDLTESMFKRAFEVKDSGRILPGHGGLLDRIDGLLFVGPYVYAYATLIALR